MCTRVQSTAAKVQANALVVKTTTIDNWQDGIFISHQTIN
jgi:hypothetical protein